MSYLGSKTCQTKASYIIMILTRISLFGLAVGWGESCSQWMLCEGTSTFFFLLDEFLRERESGQERLKVVDNGWRN